MIKYTQSRQLKIGECPIYWFIIFVTISLYHPPENAEHIYPLSVFPFQWAYFRYGWFKKIKEIGKYKTN